MIRPSAAVYTIHRCAPCAHVATHQAFTPTSSFAVVWTSLTAKARRLADASRRAMRSRACLQETQQAAVVALPQVPDQCPQDIADLIHDCLRSRALERPTIRQAFNRIKHSAAIAAATSSHADGFMMP